MNKSAPLVVDKLRSTSAPTSREEESNPGFDKRISACIDRALDSIGKDVKDAFYFQVKSTYKLSKEQIATRPVELAECLKETVGEKGSSGIARLIIREIKQEFALVDLSLPSVEVAIDQARRKYSATLVAQLKEVLKPLKTSFRINPELISKDDPSISEVTLTPDGVVCVLNGSGTVACKPLELFQSDTLLNIMSEVLPQVKMLVSARLQRLGGRVNVIGKISEELRKVPATPRVPA